MQSRAGKGPAEWNATTKSKCVFGIAAGMAYLHEKGIIHRDLTPDNVLLDANNEPVIGGLGFAAKSIRGEWETGWAIEAPFFIAPEVFEDRDAGDGPPYGLPADVYSFSVLLYLLFSRDDRPKLEGGKVIRTARQLVMQVGQGARYERSPEIPEYYWGLITRCWAHVPMDRPTFEAILAEFGESHAYVLPGADLTEVRRYEAFVTAGLKKSP
jgi:serine/threonine protein kinase